MAWRQLAFIIIFVLFLFLSLSQFFFSVGATFYNSQRLAQGMLLFAVGCLVCLQQGAFVELSKIRSLRWAFFAGFSVLFLVFGVVSALLSVDAINSLMYVIKYALLFLLTVVIAAQYSRKFGHALIALIVVFHCALILYSTLFLTFALFDGVPLKASIIYFGFDNIRFFNQAQVFVLPFLVWFSAGKSVSSLAHVFIFLNLILLFLGKGLGVALTWFLVCIVLFVFSKGLALKMLLHAFGAYTLVTVLLMRVSFAEAGNIITLDDSGRLSMWQTLLESLEWHHLFLGIGPGLYSVLNGLSRFSHPHNMVLELICEWGVIACLAAIMLVFITLRAYLSSVFQRNCFSMGDAFLLSWMGGLCYSMVSGVFVMPVPQTLIFVSWGLLLGYIGQFGTESCEIKVLDSKSRSCVSPDALLGVLRIFSLVLALIYATMVCLSVSAMSDDDISTQGPRLWLNGIRYL